MNEYLEKELYHQLKLNQFNTDRMTELLKENNQLLKDLREANLKIEELKREIKKYKYQITYR